MKLGEICSQCVLCFFLILLMWTGITYVTQNIQYTRAKQVHDELVMRIENSNCDAKTIADCKHAAGQCGYDLMVDTYETAYGTQAKVILDMKFWLPVLNKGRCYIFLGYAQ